MKTHRIKNVAADDDVKWYAAAHAQFHSTVNKSSFSQKKQLTATRMEVGAGLVYRSSLIKLNYRKTMASVKVEAPYSVRDKVALAALEKQWELDGVVRKESAQGISYQLPRI